MANITDSAIWVGQGPVIVGTFDLARGVKEHGFLVDLHSVGCGNSALTTSVSRETDELKESCSGQRMTLAQWDTSKEMGVSLTMQQFEGRELAAAFFGEAVVVPDGTVTGETSAEVNVGDMFFTRNPRISNLVVSVGGSPLVEGTHYNILDADHGRCQLVSLPTGTSAALELDYSFEGFVNIPAFTQMNRERGIIFNGINQVGQKARIIIPRINLALDGDFGWISEAAAELTLSGSALYVQQLADDALQGGFMRIDAMFDLP